MTELVADRGDVFSKVAGLAAALVLHGAALWLVTVVQAPATSSFESGVGGLVVTIGETGGAPDIGDVQASQSEGVSEAAAEETLLEQAPPVETVPVDAVTELVDAQPVEVVTPEPVPVVEQEPVTVPVETVISEPLPVASADIPDVKAQPVETVEVQDVPPPPMPQTRPKPVETVKPVPPAPVQPVKPTETELAEAPPAPLPVTEKASPDAAPAEEHVEAQQKRGGGEFDAAASAPTRSTLAGTLQASSGAGGAPGARMSYLASLQSWLERHKRYPRAARLRRYEGTVEFRFLIDRSGSILEQAIVESSGRRILDEAVLELLKRASPLPSMPADVGGATLELTTSIDFKLR